MAAQNQDAQVNSSPASLVLTHDLALHVFFLSSSSLDLLPEEIIRTEDVPEYISSDSSLEAEDAAFGIWSTASGTSPPVAKPSASVAWLWKH
jgi:hypothetical protein